MAEWCEHFKEGTQLGWNFCPICGAPKPVEKSLYEKMWAHWAEPCIVNGESSSCKKCFEHLVKIAEEHFKGRE